MYKYKAFGLNIHSAFALPELLESDEPADVEIFKGTVDVENKKTTNTISISCLSKEKTIYHIKEVASCSIQDGRKVTIDPEPDVSDSTLRVFILTSVMGCIFFQRMMLPIHGSAVVRGDKCIVIAGESGAGKSTLTTEFLNKGFKLLTDDIAVIHIDTENKVYVKPGFPQRKLCADSTVNFCIDTEHLERLEIEDHKYLIDSNDNFVNEQVELLALIELNVSEGSSLELMRVNGVDRLSTVMNNVYRMNFINAINLHEHYFKEVARLSGAVRIFKLSRPRLGFTSDKQMELICSELGIR